VRVVSLPATVLAHVVLFLAISIAHAIVFAQGTSLTMPAALFFTWQARVLRSWYNAMPIIVSLYGAVLAAAWALREAQESARRAVHAAETEAQLQHARLAALHARLQPHFLYNALHGIAALAADAGATRAVNAIEHLSELLHASLRVDDRREVGLDDELQLTEQYLALQEMRFGDRLSWSIDVPPDLRDVLVPVLLLQPLVENAVVHGLEAGQPRTHVTITASRRADTIELRVENDGPAADVAPSPGHGVGLAATEARLHTAYGDRAALRLIPRNGRGATVDIVLPIVRTSEAPAGTLELARSR
jgi:sensor histidine kinase YesM